MNAEDASLVILVLLCSRVAGYRSVGFLEELPASFSLADYCLRCPNSFTMEDDNGVPLCLNCNLAFSSHRALRVHWARRSDCQRAHYKLEQVRASKPAANHDSANSPHAHGNNNGQDDFFPDADPPEEPQDPHQPYVGLLEKHQAHINSWNEHGPISEALVPKVELILLLDKINAPHYAFKEFMQWGTKLSATSIQSSLMTPPLSRRAVLDQLCSRYNLEGTKPIKKKVVLPNAQVEIDIVTHDFMECLYSLLTDRELMQDDNLLLLPEPDGSHSPFGSPPKQTPSTVLHDITDGSVYRDAYKVHVQVPGRDLLVPIILFIDKTFCDVNGRLTLEPVSMTLGIFKKEVRRLPNAWRSLGYVPNMAQFRSNMTSLQKATDYHFILSTILELYKTAQTHPGIMWQFPFRGKKKEVVMKIPLLLVLGDTEGHDKLCGKYQNRTKAACLCRYCNCPTADTGNPRATYAHTLGPYIQGLADTALHDPSPNERKNAKEELKSLSFHILPSAFLDVVFCDKKRGINGATVAELLHVIQNGLFLYHNVCLFGLRQYRKKGKSGKRKADSPDSGTGQATATSNASATGFEPLSGETGRDLGTQDDVTEDVTESTQAADFDSTVQLLQEFEAAIPSSDEESRQGVFTPSVKAKIDEWALILGHSLRHQSTTDYKDAVFPSGITQNAKKNGHEERNVVLILLLIFCSKQGEDLIERKFDKTRLSNFILVESLLLLIENFYRTSCFPKSFAYAFRNFMPCFLEYYATALNRQAGMKMNFVKFHLPLHYAEDLLRYGPSPSVDSSPGEGNHKTYKSDAERTQRNVSTFEEQVACRRHEGQVLGRARQDMLTQNSLGTDGIEEEAVTALGRHFIVSHDSAMMDRRGRVVGLARWKDSVLMREVTEYLQEHVLAKTPDLSVEIIGRCKVRGILYHAMPCYREDPSTAFGWHDWVLVCWPEWGPDAIPARIAAFVDVTLKEGAKMSDPMLDNMTFEHSGIYALVQALPHSLYEHTEEHDGPVRAHLSTRLVYKSGFAMQSARSSRPQLYLVHVESMFGGPIAAVPYDLQQPDGTEWLFVEPRAKWNDILQNWMKDPCFTQKDGKE